MKKILMSLAVIGACAVMSAKADSYLYWMIDQDDASGYVFDNAYLYAVDGSGNKTFLDASINDDVRDAPQQRFAFDTSTYGSSYSYLVELYADGTEDNNWVAMSSMSWDTFKGGLYQPTQQIKPVAFTSFTNVPEPTSGMMLLLGMGLLALKRKKA